MQKLSCFIVSLLLIGCAPAQDSDSSYQANTSKEAASSKPITYESDGFLYTLLDDSTLSVRRNGDFSERLEIPSSFNDKKVTQIDKNGFKNHPANEIIIPNTIEKIGSGAFSNCTNLKAIFIPKTVTVIEDRVFEGLTDLFVFCEASGRPKGYIDNIQYGDGWISGGRWNRDAVVVAYNIKSYKYIDNYLVALHNDGLYRLSKYYGDETNVICPETIDNQYVAYIGGRCFQNNTKIESVTLPSKTTDIKAQAFYGCESLNEVKVTDRLTYIYDSAFYGCKALSSITFSGENNVKYVDDYAFRESGFTTFTFHKDFHKFGACPFYDTPCEEITFLGPKADFKYMMQQTTILDDDWFGKSSKNIDGQTVTTYQIKRVICDDAIFDVETRTFVNIF